MTFAVSTGQGRRRAYGHPDGSGGGGTRTPKGFRPPHFECGALPIRLRLRTKPGRSAWGRTPLHLLSKIGAPGFEPGTSATRTQRSTGLSHAPKVWVPPAGGDDKSIGGHPRRSTTVITSVLVRRPLARDDSAPATGWDSQPRPRAMRAKGEPRMRSLRNLNPGFEAAPAGVAPPRGGIRNRGPRKRADGEPRMQSTGGSTLGSKPTPSGAGLRPSADGVGFEPTWALAHTISNRAP